MLTSLCSNPVGVSGICKSHRSSSVSAALPVRAAALKAVLPVSARVHRRPAGAHPRGLVCLAASSSAIGHQPSRHTGGQKKTGKRNIVLPVDNSEDSEYAVTWALKHLYKAGDCLHLLHCIPPFHDKTSFDAQGDVRQRHVAAAEQVRQRFEDKAISYNVPKADLVYDILEEKHEGAIFFGVEEVIPPAVPQVVSSTDEMETSKLTGDLIVEKAEEFDAAAVVMASHNKNPLAEFFLGSVTNHCIHNCSKPVVVLHNMHHGADEGATAKVPAVRNVAVAVDDSSLSEKSLQWTIDNIYRKGDTVHLMHVIPAIDDIAVADGFGESLEIVKGGDTSEKYKKMLQDANIPYEFDLIEEHQLDTVKADSVRLGSALLSKAEDLNAVLVMASHGKGAVDEFLLGSVTSFVTHNAADVPVVVLHP